MPRIIKNIYRQGLGSKLYYVAYAEPISIYRASFLIYGKEQKRHLYKSRDILIKDGGIEKVPSPKSRIQSTPKPLVREISKIVEEKHMELSEFENKLLEKILGSNFFRTYTKTYVKLTLPEEFDGLEKLLEIFDLWLFHIFTWREENGPLYLKRSGFLPYPRNEKDAQIMIEEFKKTDKEEKKQLINKLKKEINNYGLSEEILQSFGKKYNQVVDDVLKRPKNWSYHAFLHQDLLFKLIMDRYRKKHDPLTPMGYIFRNIIAQTHTTRNIGAYMLPKMMRLSKMKIKLRKS